MPFKSEKQRKFLWANYPALARKWSDQYGSKAIRKKAIKKIKEDDSRRAT